MTKYVQFLNQHTAEVTTLMSRINNKNNTYRFNSPSGNPIPSLTS